VLFLRQNPAAQAWLKRTASKHGKSKALSIMAHKLGRAVYYVLSATRRSTCNGSWPRRSGGDGQARRLTGAAMDKTEPARHPMWRDHVSHPRPNSWHPARVDWMAISLRFKAYAEESQRDLLLPRARRLTGERSALSPTLDWAGMRAPMSF
jgi:hypothetical protein